MTLLTAKLEVDGREVKDMPLRLTVEVMSPVVVTTQPLSRGDKFSQNNVALIRWPENRTPPGAMKELRSVWGRTSNIPMVPNTVVSLDNIFDPPVIHRGQEVDAIVRRGNVELSVVTEAIEDGKLGDTVRVENTESHKLLRGKVLDEKTVLIEQEQP
jgi:flagella basal body P-ring formation protein FlgA